MFSSWPCLSAQQLRQVFPYLFRFDFSADVWPLPKRGATAGEILCSYESVKYRTGSERYNIAVCLTDYWRVIEQKTLH